MLGYYKTTFSRCSRSIRIVFILLISGCASPDNSWVCIPVWVEDIVAVSCAITEEAINGRSM